MESTIPTSPADAARMVEDLFSYLHTVADSGDSGVRAALLLAEGITRQADALTNHAIAVGAREGTFARQGYRTDHEALTDLIRVDRREAKQRIAVAELTSPRIALDGSTLPPKLETTARIFAAGGMSIQHVQALATALDTPAARRIDPADWAVAEAHLAKQAASYTPRQLAKLATDLIRTLDVDGPEPDEHDQPVNELRITPRRNGGIAIAGIIDDALIAATLRTAIDAKSKPLGSDDHRTLPERQAAALVEHVRFALDHGDDEKLAGHQPHLTVTIDLADLETRGRRAVTAK